MAKSQNAFIKQENEKKRLKKRKEKLQKKEIMRVDILNFKPVSN